MERLLMALAVAPLVMAVYAYLAYPLILMLVGVLLPRRMRPRCTEHWPMITLTVPVYNGVGTIAATLERLLALDYPRGRMQLLVLSDASSDGTDDVVRGFASRGVELLRLPERRGKTVAENAAVAAARGSIIVNVDATVQVPAPSLKALVRTFADPQVGLASGCDVSTGHDEAVATGSESSYVGYEMWVRQLETRVGSIVGASGCFYAIRRTLHGTPLPAGLSWDFASALVARQHGLRAISVPDAICVVPRTREIGTEVRRKTRTMARGIRTLLHMRSLMNPVRYPAFAWMLVSHKLMRWLPYLIAPLSFAALAYLAATSTVALAAFVSVLIVIVTGTIVLRRPSIPTFGRLLAPAGFVVATGIAGIMAWRDALLATSLATWDPTPRPETQS